MPIRNGSDSQRIWSRPNDATQADKCDKADKDEDWFTLARVNVAFRAPMKLMYCSHRLYTTQGYSDALRLGSVSTQVKQRPLRSGNGTAIVLY